MPSELESWNHSKVIQVSNLAMTCTKEQIRTLFGYLGRIDEVKMYPAEDSPIPATSKVFYVKFDDPVTTGVACHLTNTVFIDRALVIVPVLDGKIPDEQTALQISAPGASQPGQPVMGTPNWPQDIVNQTTGMGLNQVHTTYDPKLSAMGLPQYPPLSGTLDPHKVEEIRRTIYITNLDTTVTSEMLLTFFSQIGEVKYVRMAGDEAQLTKCAFVEFSEMSSVATALTYNGVAFVGKPLKIGHANNAIVKPGASAMMPSREMEEAMKKVKEAQSLITSAVETDLGKRSRSRSRSRRRRSRSRSRRKSRSRSKGRSRRSRSRTRRSSSRTRRRTRSPRRRRSRSRHRSRSRSKDRKRREDKDRKRDRSRTRRSRRSRSGSRERRRSRSRSRHRRRSRSPAKKSSRSPSPPKIERIRSLSPKRKGSSRSPSPLKKSKSRRSKSRSRSPKKSSSSRHKKEKRRDRDRDSREREGKSKKKKDKDRDRDRDRDREHGEDRKSSEQKEVKIKRDYDEEEKGYDSDKSEDRKEAQPEESKPPEAEAESASSSSEDEEREKSKPAPTDDLQEMDMDVDSD
ncbi:splicing regulatory glutamine/lysine-rich protein 1 isoform X2 [Lingula anatina]|uniref:Splicing regulatory glutamine/lysine-rich protein 1 isoform X2 n=1 Tax=Lingula anatina TaxID=7574 RepID=A0A1S3HUY5_LINAN|nr:splicing regulatory glutamine/lysine-rich protein 1 isoform X2 [Lingula anatina]|eukprot:XP_013389852.1 splicing regulatory glutamine/lysine-rich protein 1 isoform X2 [Lingula anatina]